MTLQAVDMWSVGVILFILLGGSPPFYDRDEVRQRHLMPQGFRHICLTRQNCALVPGAQDALFDKIKRADYTFQPRIIWECVSDEAKVCIYTAA